MSSRRLTNKDRYHSLYTSRSWLKLRARQLREQPFCAFCQAKGIVSSAKIADHIRPHKGDLTLFNDPTNLQSLCQPCHDSTKKAIEARGYSLMTDARGLPIDSRHPANK